MSKTLTITGLGQETDFTKPSRTVTVIIINGGELRIPIDEGSAEKLLAHVLKGYEPDAENQETHSNGLRDDSYPDDNDYAELEEEAEKEAEERKLDQQATLDDEVYDESGAPQI